MDVGQVGPATLTLVIARRNNDNKSYEEEGLKVSSGEESRGHRSLEISHSFSSNLGCRESLGHRYLEISHTYSSYRRGRGRRSSMIIHSASRNCREYVEIGGSVSQETINSSSFNRETLVHVEGRCGYRSPTRYYSPHNQVQHGILLIFPGDTVGGDGRVGYRYQTRHYYY